MAGGKISFWQFMDKWGKPGALGASVRNKSSSQNAFLI